MLWSGYEQFPVSFGILYETNRVRESGSEISKFFNIVMDHLVQFDKNVFLTLIRRAFRSDLKHAVNLNIVRDCYFCSIRILNDAAW